MDFQRFTKTLAYNYLTGIVVTAAGHEQTHCQNGVDLKCNSLF